MTQAVKTEEPAELSHCAKGWYAPDDFDIHDEKE